jgi:hypothetical protein
MEFSSEELAKKVNELRYADNFYVLVLLLVLPLHFIMGFACSKHS